MIAEETEISTSTTISTTIRSCHLEDFGPGSAMLRVTCYDVSINRLCPEETRSCRFLIATNGSTSEVCSTPYFCNYNLKAFWPYLYVGIGLLVASAVGFLIVLLTSSDDTNS